MCLQALLRDLASIYEADFGDERASLRSGFDMRMHDAETQHATAIEVRLQACTAVICCALFCVAEFCELCGLGVHLEDAEAML